MIGFDNILSNRNFLFNNRAVNEILDTAYCSNTEGGVCTPDYIVAL